MNDDTEFDTEHPLWAELRNGLLWHRTSAKEYRQICTCGFIRPNDGRINRWGGKYACQQLGAVSLFDFTSQPESKVLGEVVKWQQFLGDAGPATVLLGLSRPKLTGRLIPYPDNKEGTTGNVIPWVEICHCGPIPVSAIACYLLVCAVDYARFKKFEVLDEQALSEIEAEYGDIVRLENEKRARFFEKVNNSPEWKARIEEANRLIEKMRRKK